MKHDIPSIKAANPLSEVIAELTGQTGRRVGAEVRFHCVFHSPDLNPSLNANDEKDGGVWICRSCGKSGDVIDFVQEHERLKPREALDFLARRRNVPSGVRTSPSAAPKPHREQEPPKPSRRRPGEIERFHDYRRDGVVIARKVLLKQRDADGKKCMEWQRPDGSGGWIDRLDGLDPGLFGLEDATALKGSGGLVWCEGEKDAAALLAMRVPAVSSPHGAMVKINPRHVAAVLAAGFTSVYVTGDNDDSGTTCNANVVRACREGGLTDVRPVPWEPDRPKGFDVSDFLAEHPKDGKRLFLQRCRNADPAAPDSDAGERAEPAAPRSGPATPEPILICMADVEPEAVSWLWTRRLARGKITILAGDPGVGKSFLTLDLAARLTTGRPWPDGEAASSAADVILLAAEDGIADTMRPRLDAMGGDSKRAHVLRAIRLGEGDERAFSLQTDLAQLEEAIQRTGAGLVVIDPVSNYVGGTDSYRDTEVRQMLTPVAMMAERTGVAVILVMHLTKDAKVGALYRLNSSIAFGGVARIVLAVGTDPDEPNPYAPHVTRALASVKQNICAPATPWAFRTVENRVEWIGPREDLTPDRLLAPPAHRETAAREDVETFLCRALADGQYHASDELEAAASDAGITSARLHRSRKALCESKRVGAFGPGGRWMWRLKPEHQAGRLDAHSLPPNPPFPLHSPHGANNDADAPLTTVESTTSSFFAPDANNGEPANNADEGFGEV